MKLYDLPTKNVLKRLWASLKENISSPKDTTERIHYKDFKNVAKKIQFFLNIFIELLSFFHVFRKNICEENKINISIYDFCCEGFLVVKDLESYIKNIIINCPFYIEISEEIKEYYLLVAQIFLFFSY